MIVLALISLLFVTTISTSSSNNTIDLSSNFTIDHPTNASGSNTTLLTSAANVNVPGCHLHVNDGNDAIEYCKYFSDALLEFQNFFKTNEFGTNYVMNIETEIILSGCRRLRNCPRTVPHRCNLPILFEEEDYVCRRVFMIAGDFGDCARKFATSNPTNYDLKVFLKGFDDNGRSKRCDILKYAWSFKDLTIAIRRECGARAMQPLWEYRDDLESIYGCR